MKTQEINLQAIIDEQYEFRDYFYSNIELLQKAVLKSQFPLTGRYFIDFYRKSDSIKDAIVQILNSENIYPAFILYRSLIEHYFKFYYGYVRINIDKSDAVGKDYRTKLWLSEFLSVELNNMTIKEILNGKHIQKKFEKVLSKHSDLKPPENYNRAINDNEKKKFDFKNILRYCIEHKDKFDDGITNVIEYHLNFISEFNKYSTFVHGGPISDTLTDELNKNIRSSYEFSKLFTSSFVITNLLGQYLKIFLIAIDKDLESKMPKTRTTMDYTKTNTDL